MMDILDQLYVYHVQILSILLYIGRIHGQCSGSTATFDIGYSTVIVTAPNYPNGYGINQDCKWLGTTSIAGASVLFRVTEITSSCAGDFINVYDGTSTSGTHKHTDECQSGSGARTLGYNSATSGNVYLTFTSDSSTSASEIGFKIYLISSQDFAGTGCTSAPQAITATSTEEYLSTPGFPAAYAKNLQCTWVITASSTNAKVYVEIKFLSIEECQYDYLDILESGTSIEKLCTETWEPTQTYTSTDNSLTLNFKSDGFGASHRGFLLSYKEIESPTSMVVTEEHTTTMTTDSETVSTVSQSPTTISPTVDQTTTEQETVEASTVSISPSSISLTAERTTTDSETVEVSTSSKTSMTEEHIMTETVEFSTISNPATTNGDDNEDFNRFINNYPSPSTSKEQKNDGLSTGAIAALSVCGTTVVAAAAGVAINKIYPKFKQTSVSDKTPFDTKETNVSNGKPMTDHTLDSVPTVKIISHNKITPTYFSQIIHTYPDVVETKEKAVFKEEINILFQERDLYK